MDVPFVDKLELLKMSNNYSVFIPLIGHIIAITERVPCPGVDMLAVGLRPYYLPLEFSHVITAAVYVTSTTSVRSPFCFVVFFFTSMHTKSNC